MYTLRTLYPMFHCILCICHGLRLSNLNKETTYLLTYLHIINEYAVYYGLNELITVFRQ